MLLYISYAAQDSEFRDDLCRHLATLERDGRVRVWHSGLLSAGEVAQTSVEEHLTSAGVIVLLLSAHYLADPTCENEAARALDMARRGCAQIVPILVRPCLVGETSLASFRLLPSDGRPIEIWENREAAWVDVATGIAQVGSARTANTAINRPPSTKDLAVRGATPTRVPTGHWFAIAGAGLAGLSFFAMPWATLMTRSGIPIFTGTGYGFMADSSLLNSGDGKPVLVTVPLAVAVILTLAYVASKNSAPKNIIIGRLANVVLMGFFSMAVILLMFGQFRDPEFSAHYGLVVAILGFALVSVAAGVSFFHLLIS